MSARVVQNEGSAARDHLANERTFLAWFRTALGLVGLGVLLERLGLEGRQSATLAGLALISFGAIVLIYAIDRYRRVAVHLQEGSFPIAKRGPLWFGVAALVISLAAAAYLLI